MAFPRPASDEEYQSLFDSLSSGPNLVVVEFSADWCHVCTKMRPDLEKFALEHQVDFIVFDLDVLTHEDGDNVKVPPTFKIYKGGDCVAAFAGANMEKLRELVTKFK